MIYILQRPVVLITSRRSQFYAPPFQNFFPTIKMMQLFKKVFLFRSYEDNLPSSLTLNTLSPFPIRIIHLCWVSTVCSFETGIPGVPVWILFSCLCRSKARSISCDVFWWNKVSEFNRFNHGRFEERSSPKLHSFLESLVWNSRFDDLPDSLLFAFLLTWSE